MIKPIMRDPLFLAQKSEPATEADKQVVQDHLCFKPQHGKYTGWTAQIIQHELDHVAGIVI